jgi:uncharacterized protein YbjT (DUF2867 family)
MKKILLAGGTGLIGSEVQNYLLDQDGILELHSLVRRPSGTSHERLFEHVVDFDHLEAIKSLEGLDTVFCCLGTTMKKAGSREAFRKVDYEYPLALAKLAKAAGATTFVLVSSMGANSHSAFFYSRVKGDIEDAIGKLHFKSTIIVRPSLLLGDRNEKRLGEDIGKVFMKLIPYTGRLKNYKPIYGRQVAKAMVKAAAEFKEGHHILESGLLHRY